MIASNKDSGGNDMACTVQDSRRWFVPRCGLVAFVGILFLVTTVLPANGAERPVSFVNDVVPLLTKAGCNVGVCHAKAGGGQK